MSARTRPSRTRLRTLTRNYSLLILPSAPSTLTLRTLLTAISGLRGLATCNIILAVMSDHGGKATLRTGRALGQLDVPIFGRVVEHLATCRGTTLTKIPICSANSHFNHVT